MLLSSNDELTSLVKAKEINTWAALKKHIKKLPYGRNNDRSNLSLVIKNNKGTCSSKHAILKQIADLNSVPRIKLILCLYKMNSANTPGIGHALIENYLNYIPEAHCYLIDNGEALDLTTADSDISRVENDIIEELEITPKEVNEFKVNYHKDYLMKWMVKERISISFEQLWSIREQCIANLSSSS